MSSKQPQRKTRNLYQRYNKMAPCCDRCDRKFSPNENIPVRLDEVHINLRLWLCIDCATKVIHAAPLYYAAQAYSVTPIMLPNGYIVQYATYYVVIRLKENICCKVGEC